ncbi:MAG TPA: hypothetical protein VJU59_34730 [Paraburkholderia sp.]|uniref:hypothetical protein n=1 Tax=Paraburkholderia sp. TaxID=1926495 RepID=UPI002B4850E4|nr:hypothetical protein [Paraburkholderia sp.]HKR44774.1 hypothetical protein [Paraburkholderia sp.]
MAITEDNKSSSAPADAHHFIEQLDALQPGKQQQKNLLFQKLYPAIERALARQVPQKAIIAELGKMGLHLSMGGFRSLLEAERKQHNENGERVHCVHCGSYLPREGDGGSGTPALAVG